MEWLRRAIEAGHPGAVALRDSHDLRTEAAAVAYQYGRALEADGTKASIAHCFYRLAAETGHPQAVAKITDMVAPSRPGASGMPMAAPVPEVSFAEHLPELLDGVFADQFSYQLSTPWQQAPPLIESVQDQQTPAGDPPTLSGRTQSPGAEPVITPL
ncbi:hypothetical protein [Nonomuraea sp. LPB2021202275-12-8]|uniref:hypothetical protein n=1 Tax=Nonomuraea sp. LPB2021202275-12-8 TaxID=3120159 RepID=UPI00300C4175